MREILSLSSVVLQEAGFTSMQVEIAGQEALLFEDSVALGFVLAYATPKELVVRWAEDAANAIDSYRFALRRGGEKAWNTYVVLLSEQAATYVDAVSLAGIEEDLTGTRKIARAGVVDVGHVRAALLPLLPLQSAPHLDAVDICSEIRERTSELPEKAVDAFLSAADDHLVLQILGETP